MAQDNATRYIEPKRYEAILHRSVSGLTRLGISLWGSRVLAVRGRKSGHWRTNPVNLMTFEGERYLVAPRGHTQWVRNLRVAGGGELRLGKRAEAFTAIELDDEAKPELLRAYLKRWAFEVGMFFDGVDAKASPEKLLEITPGYPVFRVVVAG
ncbi:nitroreductase family deazaflavin-dependent oxidoreductase [Amycolatopsis palatopharyngis]|uniref:nitroreductase family deazaflavin-dependent oxidoreductase n=1 Tax=Amycolatopsis palatopharyngis TaxID=187982 RepID=UPI0013BE9940|nr:nitroreductase family deazaflavin-dependent oxidoreductase [Amycolatopsis palatopharyngis]